MKQTQGCLWLVSARRAGLLTDGMETASSRLPTARLDGLRACYIPVARHLVLGSIVLLPPFPGAHHSPGDNPRPGWSPAKLLE
ncbi:hypothetical protein RB213_012991 [Colletotrichum asianum]